MIRLAKAAAAIAAVTASVVVIPPDATGASDCTTTVASTTAAASAVASAAPGATVCLADGTYGKLTVSATKAAPGVTIRAEHPGQATIAGATLDGSYLTVAQFRMTGTFEPKPGSTGMRADHNLFVGGGYYAVMAAATTTTTVNDVAITNNRFDGRFDEDAIRLNRYHDGPDADNAGILIEGNEFLGNVEYGGHNDVLQSVWVGDHLVFRRNYLHHFGGQGFFIKDQSTAIDGLVVEDNLILDQSNPCDPVSLCPTWQLSPFQIWGPATDVSIRHNTVWPGQKGGQAWLRGSGWGGAVTLSDNVFDDLNSDASGLTLDSANNSRCAGYGLPATGFATDCSPAFADPASGDYRLANGRGVTWSVADQHYGPEDDGGDAAPPPPPPSDTTAPQTTLSAGPSGPTSDARPSFSFSADESGATFSCRADSGVWIRCTSPWTSPTLADGPHSVSVRARDAAGNNDPSPAARAFTIDTTAPRTTIASAPPADVAFAVNEAGATSQCRLDEEPWVPCTSPYRVSGVGAGHHTVSVRARDAAGNVEAPGAAVAWTTDAAPEPKPGEVPRDRAPASAPPTVRLMVSAGERLLSLEATARDDHRIDHVDFWVDGERIARDTRAPYRARLASRDVRAGTHTVSARVFDAAGRAASAATTVKVVGGAGRVQARFGRVLPAIALRAAERGDGVVRLVGRTEDATVVRVALARCSSDRPRVVDRFGATADGSGRLDVSYAGRDVCILRLRAASGTRARTR